MKDTAAFWNNILGLCIYIMCIRMIGYIGAILNAPMLKSATYVARRSKLR